MASMIQVICNIVSSVNNTVLSQNVQICDHLRSKGHVKTKEITVLHILANGKISVKVYKQISNILRWKKKTECERKNKTDFIGP